MTQSGSSVDNPLPDDRFDPELDCQKGEGRTLGDHRPDIEFVHVVQLLVHVRS